MRDDKPMDLDDAEEPPRRKQPLRSIPTTDWYRHPAVIVGGVCGVLIVFAMIGVGAWLVLSAKKKGQETEPSAEQTTYTLKPPASSTGKKVQVTRNHTVTFTVTAAKRTDTVKDEEREEYVQTVLEEANSKPTKIRRSYRFAQKGEKNAPLQDLPYSGKVVTIQKEGDIWTFTADGRKLSPLEATSLVDDFSDSRSLTTADRLPKSPVKLNETWTIDPNVWREAFLDAPFPFDTNRGSMTGRLANVYKTNDGKQWGVLEYKTDLFIDTRRATDMPEKITYDTTVEMPIDGSPYEGKNTTKLAAAWVTSPPQQGTVKVNMDGLSTKTTKLVD